MLPHMKFLEVVQEAAGELLVAEAADVGGDVGEEVEVR